MAEPANEELPARVAGMEKHPGSKKIGGRLLTRGLKPSYICLAARRVA